MMESTEHTKFWESLDRWHRVVNHMRRKGRAPLGVTEDYYIRIHRDLLEQVGRPDSQQGVEKWRQSLHHSVRPWVNLESLAHCDKRVLRLLEEEVRMLRNQLMPRQYRHRQVLQRLAVAFVVFAIAVITIVLVSSGDPRAAGITGLPYTLWNYVDGVKSQVWHGMWRSTTNQRLFFLAATIVVVGMFFLRSPKRS